MNTLRTANLLAAVVALTLGHASHASSQNAPPAQAAPSMTGCSDDIRHNATREQTEFTSNGRTIRGLIYKPRTSNGAGVVLLHGFRGLQADAPMFDAHAIQLASRGYTVLVPGFFDSRPWRDRKTGQDMEAWREAGADAVRHVGTQTGVDPGKVALWGFSLGGYLATDGSMAQDATAAAAVGVASGTDVWSEPSRGRRTIPILMIHGRADPSISASSMRSLAANLRLRGAAVEVEMIDSNQHVPSAASWCTIFQSTRRFLDANLLTPAAPTAASPS